MNKTHLLAISVTLCTLALLMLVPAPAAYEEDTRHRVSTFFTDDTGTRALLLVAEHQLSGAGVSRLPLSSLEMPDAGYDSLMVAQPEQPLGYEEADRLEEWLKAGGQLVYLGDQPWKVQDARQARMFKKEDDEQGPEDFLAAYHLNFQASSLPAAERQARGPSAQGLETLYVRPGGQWLDRNFFNFWSTNVLATVEGKPLAVSATVGKGRIVAIADPNAASNLALRQGDNATWLLAIVSHWGKGRLLIDEYHHGFGERPSLNYLVFRFLFKTWWGRCILQVLGAGALYFLLYRRRLGDVWEKPEPPADSPLTLIEARAALFRNSRAGALALEQLSWVLKEQLSRGRGREANLAEMARELSGSADRHSSGALLELFLKELEAARAGSSPSPARIVYWSQFVAEFSQEVAQ